MKKPNRGLDTQFLEDYTTKGLEMLLTIGAECKILILKHKRIILTKLKKKMNKIKRTESKSPKLELSKFVKKQSSMDKIWLKNKFTKRNCGLITSKKLSAIVKKTSLLTEKPIFSTSGVNQLNIVPNVSRIYRKM